MSHPSQGETQRGGSDSDSALLPLVRLEKKKIRRKTEGFGGGERGEECPDRLACGCASLVRLGGDTSCMTKRARERKGKRKSRQQQQQQQGCPNSDALHCAFCVTNAFCFSTYGNTIITHRRTQSTIVRTPLDV